MDTWPGSVFKPLSLHKYFYCEGNPVNRWDHIGKFSITTITMRMMTFGILTSVVYVGGSYLAKWLSGIQKSTKWNGWVIPVTFGNPASIWAIGIFIAHFSGEHPEIEPKSGWGRYLLIMGGIGRGLPWNTSFSVTSLVSPGIKGANPLSLVGPASWVSLSLSFGMGVSITHFTMGFAHTKPSKIFSVITGWDIDGEIIAGISGPLNLSTWDW